VGIVSGFVEAFRVAVSGLLANKFRSFLTVVGIFIGVFAVVLVSGVGAGAREVIGTQVSSLGSNTIEVYPAEVRAADSGTRTGRLTRGDEAALRDPTVTPGVGQVAPVHQTSQVFVVAGRPPVTLTMTGTNADYAPMYGRSASSGRLVSIADVRERDKVVVLGPKAARKIFGPSVKPVGQSVRIGRGTFEVIGVLTPRGSTFGIDLDSLVIAPYTAVEDVLIGRVESYSSIVAQPAVLSRDGSDAALGSIVATLLERHRVTTPEQLDFNTFDSASFAATSESITTVLQSVLLGVAAISLLVGGIGVMNIMMVTITERTREIGVRKAIGGRQHQILGQFLIEAVVLSSVGGVLGIAAGFACSFVNVSGYRLIVQPTAVAIAFAVSVGTGVFFGYYPARKAARLRPIDALRYE
jgi:putative ABC transport system permease protein